MRKGIRIIPILLLIYWFPSFSQTIQLTTKSNIADTSIKKVKLITNKEEFDKRFKTDSISYKTPMPYQNIKGTNIWLAPPRNFKYSERINGFIHLATTTSITCQEIKGFHFTKIVENLTPETLAKQNAVLKSIEDVTTSTGMPAKLVTLWFSLPSKDTTRKETPFERMMLFTGNLDNTLWISATYPESVKPFVFEIVRNSLLSVKYE